MRIEAWWQRRSHRFQCPTRKKLNYRGIGGLTSFTSFAVSAERRNSSCSSYTRYPPPKPLDTTTNIAENWKQFKQIWENYAIITNLTEQYRVALFFQCLAPDAMKIYNGIQFASETDRRTLSKIVEKFDEFTIGEVNETY